MAQARGFLGRGPSLRYRSVMQFADLFGETAFEADGSTIGASRQLAVDRLADAEGIAAMDVEESGMARTGPVAYRLASAERCQYRIIEAL